MTIQELEEERDYWKERYNNLLHEATSKPPKDREYCRGCSLLKENDDTK